jgi:hypothetical protein
MLAACLHAVGGDGPDLCSHVDLSPCRAQYLTGPGACQDGEGQGTGGYPVLLGQGCHEGGYLSPW